MARADADLLSDMESAESAIRAKVQAIDDMMTEKRIALQTVFLELERSMKDLNMEEAGVADRAARIRADLEKVKAEMNALRSTQSMLARQAQSLPAEIASMRADADSMTEALRSSESTTERAEVDASYRVGEMQRGVEAFAPLGIRFDTGDDGRVRIVFTRVDEASPEREFSFTVQADEEGAFTLVACEPAVADAADRVAALNEDQDFGRFVRGMRRTFKSMV